MAGPTRRDIWRPGALAVRGVARLAGVVAWVGAVAVGAALAVVFAATILVISVSAFALLMLAGAGARARRVAEPPSDILEARRIGGHSWVAYGWDGARPRG